MTHGGCNPAERSPRLAIGIGTVGAVRQAGRRRLDAPRQRDDDRETRIVAVELETEIGAEEAQQPLAGRRHADPLVEGAPPVLRQPDTVVPDPAADEMRRWPPVARTRSETFCSPEPGRRRPGSKPRPSSITEKTSDPSRS